MKKFLLILLLVVLLAFGGFAFMFYKSFDEEAYRAQVIASTKELTGRDMVINGQFSLNIFPSPVIRISDVIIKNKAGEKQTDFIKIASIEAHIRFASLFKNPLIIENVILNEPQVFLSRNEKGDNNWDLAFFKAFDKAIVQDDLIGKAFVDLPPQFQNMQLKKGSISYKNALTYKQNLYKIIIVAEIAQLVEQLIRNQQVVGSSPIPSLNKTGGQKASGNFILFTSIIF